MPGRLPDPAPGAGERLRRLQTEPLPRRLRAPAGGDDVVEPAPEPDAVPPGAGTEGDEPAER